MTPADYLRIIVLPTLAEMMEAPADQRRAYLACIAAAHLVDHIRVALGLTEQQKHEVREKVRALGPYPEACLAIVEGVSNGTKHAGAGRGSTRGAFTFTPGHEEFVPGFALDTPGAGLDESRWDRPGLAVAYRTVDGSPGLGSYCIDDCVRVVVRSYALAFPALLSVVDLSVFGPEFDRTAWFSDTMAIFSKVTP